MSKYIYGIHDIEGAHLMNGKGWVVATEEVGADPNNHNGVDYTQSAKGATVICRLNYSYGNGTIPTPDKYTDFARRCANFAKNTKGCFLYIIGNEPNLLIEQPPGQDIQPERYAECYSLCRHLIQLESNVLVGTAGIGPWNTDTGDWIDYFVRMLSMANILGDVDFIALHTYTHGADPNLIFSDQKMNAPYQDRYYHFYAYLDFMDAIPADLRTVPVFITETNQNDAWVDTNSGWVQNAYDDIDNWNVWHTQKISCLALYRYPSYDKYNIVGKQGVIDDLIASQQHDYTWSTEDPPPGGEMTEIFRDGFEGQFYHADDHYDNKQSVSELECPIGWSPDWEVSTGPGVNHRPEYKPKDKRQGHPEVYEGQQAIGIHTTTSSHDGVLFRRFQVTPGAKIKASVWAMGKGDGSGHGMSVGIDPTGATNFKTLDGNYWGEWWGTDNGDWVNGEWRNISQEIIANSNIITVYLRTVARYANSNAAHFDSFLLESDLDGPIDPPVDPPEPPIDPPVDGGIQDHIDAIQATLDSLQDLVNSSGIRALPI
jgi:hypothetical protein